MSGERGRRSARGGEGGWTGSGTLAAFEVATLARRGGTSGRGPTSGWCDGTLACRGGALSTCTEGVSVGPDPISVSAGAACGGLRSTPDCRPRRTFLHLSYSCTTPFGPAILVTQDPFRTSPVRRSIRDFILICARDNPGPYYDHAGDRYSITSSARSRIDCGIDCATARPSALPVSIKTLNAWHQATVNPSIQLAMEVA
jgi:hypothetical protein